MIRKTKDYEIFKLRNDNREKIDEKHVERLKNSIRYRNLLELRPIVVNTDFEIIDGQHRYLAAKSLGVDIYYNVDEKLNADDVIIMNTAKVWNNADYLNFYVKNGYKEYILFNEFLNKNKLAFKIAFSLICGKGHAKFEEFRIGKFVMPDLEMNHSLELCWQTVDYIKSINGTSWYLTSARFWKALINLINHPQFEEKRWFNNLKKLVNRVGIRSTTKEYMQMIYDIYCYGLREKLSHEYDGE